MAQQSDLYQFSLVQLTKQGEEREIAVNMSRRLFVVSGLLLLSGCASSGPQTTRECMQLSTGGAQMECLFNRMFPELVLGVVIGAAAGAVLGGAVAFAVGGNPLTGLAVGGIAGGVAGGLIAYYNFTLKRANGDPVRALNDIHQDGNTNLRQCQRFSDASGQECDETTAIFESGKVPTNDQRQEIENGLVIRAGFSQNQSESIKVYRGVTKKFSENTATAGARNNNELLESIDQTLKGILSFTREIKEDYDEVKRLILKQYGVSAIPA